MLRMMIAAITTDTGRWEVDDSLAMPGFKLGPGSDYFSTSLVQGEPVRGAKILEIAGKHHTVVIQHWAKPLVTLLKGAGVKRVLLWCDLDAMPPNPYWSQDLATLWETFRVLRMESAKLNKYGQRMVDLYEKSSGGPLDKPHCWAVQLESPQFPMAYVGAVMNAWLSGYQNVGADGLFLDDMHEHPYFGTAGNAPEITAELIAQRLQAMQTITRGLRIFGIPYLMGNSGATTRAFTSLTAKFDELYFAPSAPQNFVDKAVEHFSSSAAAGRMQDLMMGVDGIAAMPSEALIDAIVLAVRQYNPAALYKLGLVTARTGGWLFCPKVFQ